MKNLFLTLILGLLLTFQSKANINSVNFNSLGGNSHDFVEDFLSCEDQAFIAMVYVDSIYDVDGFTLGAIWQSVYDSCRFSIKT